MRVDREPCRAMRLVKMLKNTTFTNKHTADSITLKHMCKWARSRLTFIYKQHHPWVALSGSVLIYQLKPEGAVYNYNMHPNSLHHTYHIVMNNAD